MASLVILLGLIAACAALPADVADPVIIKLGGEERYTPMRGGDGVVHMVDTWLKASDLRQAARYSPDSENVYHLFSRANPTVSQPLLLGAAGLLSGSNYSPDKRTVIIVHGYNDNVLGTANSVLIPAFLEAEDVNVISVDWSAGAGTISYLVAVVNTVTSGESAARFIDWLMASTGSVPEQFHIVGHSLGGHQAGIIGRNVNGDIAYITALDPALPGWVVNSNKFRANDGAYTEVIHTNAGIIGSLVDLGQVDFYPNGGIGMPGCGFDRLCDHDRCFYYFAESLRTGGFTGTRCANYLDALAGNCLLSGSLQMGGLQPKTGQTGIFHLDTNSEPPFSRG